MPNEPQNKSMKPEDAGWQKPDFQSVGGTGISGNFERRAADLLARTENFDKMLKFLKIDGLEELLKQLHDPDIGVVLQSLTTLKGHTTEIFGEETSLKWMSGFIEAAAESHQIQPLSKLEVRDGQSMAQQVMDSQTPKVWNEEQMNSFMDKISALIPKPTEPPTK